MNHRLGAAVLVLVTGVGIAAEFAIDRPALLEKEAASHLAKTRISLAQAISLAEGHVAGRATSAEFEAGPSGVIAQVRVMVSERKFFEVKVNAIDGSIVSSKARHDQDD